MKSKRIFALATSVLALALAVCPPPASAAVDVYLWVQGGTQTKSSPSTSVIVATLFSTFWL